MLSDALRPSAIGTRAALRGAAAGGDADNHAQQTARPVSFSPRNGKASHFLCEPFSTGNGGDTAAAPASAIATLRPDHGKRIRDRTEPFNVAYCHRPRGIAMVLPSPPVYDDPT